MSIALDLRIQQLTAQRSMLQYRLIQGISAVHRVVFRGNNHLLKNRGIEMPLVLNNWMTRFQLDMITEELNALKKQRRIDYLA